MPSYTYPVVHETGTLTAAQIHLLLRNPNVIAKRAATLADQKFIADYLLSGRFNAVGGGIFYENGDQIFPSDSPEEITPGAGYRKTVLTQGDIVAAKTSKLGFGTDITDEKISREGIQFVNKAIRRLVNGVVRDVDQRAMAVISSVVTATSAATAAWTTAGAVLETLVALHESKADGTGIDMQTVLLSPAKYAKLIGILVNASALPREAGNLFLSGNLPFDALGYTWVTSPRYTSANPMFIDRDILGGMADEHLESPEFRSAGESNVEVSSTREAGVDKYEVRARRVVVPVVLEPLAGVTITGTSL
jgi:hypothetical protein